MEAKASKSSIFLLLLSICFLIQTGESAVTSRTFTFPFPFPFPFPLPFFQTPPSPLFPFPTTPIPGPPNRQARACLDDFHNGLRSSKTKQDSAKLDVTYALCQSIKEVRPKCWPVLFPNTPSLLPSLLANCGSPAPGPAPFNPPNHSTI